MFSENHNYSLIVLLGLLKMAKAEVHVLAPQ